MAVGGRAPGVLVGGGRAGWGGPRAGVFLFGSVLAPKSEAVDVADEKHPGACCVDSDALLAYPAAPAVISLVSALAVALSSSLKRDVLL